MMEESYLVIDLKSFYASVECAVRGLDPMTTDLVVADPERTDKTICLAVSPSLKAKGVKNRCRVFDIPAGLDYIMAEPHMQRYIDYAAEIYGIYLRYISPEDIHVYSIDESFLRVTPYLGLYHMTAHQFARFLMDKVEEELNIRATCGIGTNLYLAKIALDIEAKHAPDFISELTEKEYCQRLWNHRPLTDFWRIGSGIMRHLAKCGIHTMEDLAHAPEDLIYDEFGIDAELLIDHAWGRESCTLAEIKRYTPKRNSITQGQVLMRDYAYEEGRLVAEEMVRDMSLRLLEDDLTATSVSLIISFSGKGFSDASQTKPHMHYGYITGNKNLRLPVPTDSTAVLCNIIKVLYDSVVAKNAGIRVINVAFGTEPKDRGPRQLSLFSDDGFSDENSVSAEKERRAEEVVLELRKRFGANAVLRAQDLSDGATAVERHNQIGGHKR